MPIVVDTLIFDQRVQPNNQENISEIQLLYILTKLDTTELTHFSNESPRAEKAPPRVDSHDIKFSTSTFSHVNIKARRHLNLI